MAVLTYDSFWYIKLNINYRFLQLTDLFLVVKLHFTATCAVALSTNS